MRRIDTCPSSGKSYMRALPKVAIAPLAPTAEGVDTFDLTPVSLWLEDYSGVKIQFEAWRREGVISLREHLAEDLGGSRPAPGSFA